MQFARQRVTAEARLISTDAMIRSTRVPSPLLRTSARSFPISLVLISVLACCAGCPHQVPDPPPTPPGPKFVDQPLNNKEADLTGLNARITIAPDSTSQQGLIGFVGLLLEVDDQPETDKPPVLHGDRSIGKYRPKAEQIQVDAQTGKTLYQGKVTKGFNAGGNYLIFTANLSDDQAAEVTIKDEVTVGFKDPGQIPYDKLAEEARRVPKGKRRFFVTSATLTSVVHKNYRAIKAETQIAGTAFGANGKVYASNEDFLYDPVVSLKVEDIGLLAPPPSENLARVVSTIPAHEADLLRRTSWTQAEAATVSEILNQHSAASARKLLNRAVLRPDESKP